MEARAAASDAGIRPPTSPDDPVVAPVALDFGAVAPTRDPLPAPAAAGAPTAAPGNLAAPGAARPRRRLAPQIVPLSRDQEFAYIRADMQRLLSIAGGLCAVMLVLLFVLGR
jgi:hypothetical protein